MCAALEVLNTFVAIKGIENQEETQINIRRVWKRGLPPKNVSSASHPNTLNSHDYILNNTSVSVRHKKDEVHIKQLTKWNKYTWIL